MEGLPVTIRLLDPPLHEFMPQAEEVAQDVERARIEQTDNLEELEHTLDRIHSLSETNPMLGTRGVRLGVLHPEIYEMQIRAIFRAALAIAVPPELEIMIPLVAYERELELMRGLVERVAEEEGTRRPRAISVGTMIELPRACFVANRIAEHADFFSFGTNDLTQTALGFSRDDVEGRFLNRYVETKIVDRSPFETIDRPGVGWLVRLAAWTGREAKPDLKLGICGEHGGDPTSIAFFQMAGLDYVSCSPYRVPIARVARRKQRSRTAPTGRVRARDERHAPALDPGRRHPRHRARHRRPPTATSSAARTGPTRRRTRASSRRPAGRCRRRATLASALKTKARGDTRVVCQRGSLQACDQVDQLGAQEGLRAAALARPEEAVGAQRAAAEAPEPRVREALQVQEHPGGDQALGQQRPRDHHAGQVPRAQVAREADERPEVRPVQGGPRTTARARRPSATR